MFLKQAIISLFLIICFWGSAYSQIGCNNWLMTPTLGAAATFGDIDIAGNQLTVEVIFNRTEPLFSGLYPGHLVSKHTDATNNNYSLFPNGCAITTTNGYVETFENCILDINKTYHVAMVYDGTTLKFYRNGFLHSSKPCTGNLITNNLVTTIAQTSGGTSSITQFLGNVNEARFWNTARSQVDIRTFMNTSLPSPATQTGLVAYYTFDNLLNKQGNSLYNGVLLGGATINTTNPQCNFVADSCGVVVPCIIKPDFTFTRNVCNSKEITFKNQTPNTSTFKWDFGNNTTNTTNQNPTVSYANNAGFWVQLIVTQTNGCKDSAGYFLDVNSNLDTSLIINKDTSICLGATFKISVKDTGRAYCWSASSGSVISNAISQTVTPATNTVYYFNSKVAGNNLVVNGDFEAGNTGFTSEHIYKTPPRTSQSQYYIGTNPNVWFNPFVDCEDHTSNSGNMMMFDGSATANTAMWKQTVAVQPNTEYLFSGWVQSIVAQDPAQIILKINGNKVGATTKADLNACSWKQFSAIWNSGYNTSVNLSILDSNIAIQGNDFAIDDISFTPLIIKTDSIKVDVTNCNVNTACKGVVELHGRDKITPPAPIKKYFAATGFTWETWFNGSYYVNENTTVDTRSKLIAALDIPQCQDIVLGFGWPQVAQKNTLCFVADGPNGCTDRDNTPCTYFPVGGFQPNTWYHVAAVRDYANNTSKLYVNGALVDSKTNNHGPINPTLLPGFIFGSWTGLGSTDSGFAGKMDEIRIWDKPRTAAEIQANYNKCLIGNETGLVAYYHANEKAGTILHDISPNANNAVLTSSVNFNKTLSAPITNPCLLTSTTDSTKTITQGQSYWGYTISGVYKDTFANSLGCDSIRTLNLTVAGFVTKRDTISKSICFGTSYLTYNNTGSFSDTFHLASYDSIRTLNLKVLPSPITTLDTIPASCGSVTYNGNVYLINTLVTKIVKNYLGCDSIIQNHQIIINQNKRDTTKVSICNGQSYLGYNVSGVYKLDSVRLSSGCDSISMVKLSVDKYVKDSINISICYGDKYGTYQYAGIYYDTIKSATFCDTIRAINLSIKAKLNPKLLDDASICEKDSIVLNPGNFYSYLWNTNTTSKTLTAKSVGTYWVQVADTFGCKARDTFNLISINPLPKDFLPNSLSVCDGEQYTLTGYYSYNWMTGETTPNISLSTLPLYSVKVTDANGCSGSDSMKVNYVGSLNIQPTNAFSPNGDGVNEAFKPFLGSCIVSFSMKIFDRWGQLLFETTNPNTGWNGMHKGSILPTAVYYYIINYKNLLGIDNRKAGSITLLR